MDVGKCVRRGLACRQQDASQRKKGRSPGGDRPRAREEERRGHARDEVSRRVLVPLARQHKVPKRPTRLTNVSCRRASETRRR